MIDAHPDVACPGETDLAPPVDAYRHPAGAFTGAPAGGTRRLVPPDSLASGDPLAPGSIVTVPAPSPDDTQGPST